MVWDHTLGLHITTAKRRYLRKIVRKTSISYPLLRTRTYAYQEEKNVSF